VENGLENTQPPEAPENCQPITVSVNDSVNDDYMSTYKHISSRDSSLQQDIQLSTAQWQTEWLHNNSQDIDCVHWPTARHVKCRPSKAAAV